MVRQNYEPVFVRKEREVRESGPATHAWLALVHRVAQFRADATVRLHAVVRQLTHRADHHGREEPDELEGKDWLHCFRIELFFCVKADRSA